MNHDEKFQQRWEFRRRDDDRDSSSDDSKSNSSGNQGNKKPKLINDLVIFEDNEVSGDTPSKLHNNNGVEFKIVEPFVKKQKPSKKKNNAGKNKLKNCLPKEKKARASILKPKEVGTLEDLKIFADSMIRELKVARQKLSARFREETRKLVPSRLVSGQTNKKKVGLLQKNKDHQQNGTNSNVKPHNFSDGLKKRNVKTNVASNVSRSFKRDRSLEMTTTNAPPQCERGRLSKKARNTLVDDSDQTVSLPYFTCPTAVPIAQPQSHRNSVALNDGVLAVVSGINSASEIETGKLMDPKNYYYHGVPGFQPELFGSFSHISCQNVSFLDQNCSQTTNMVGVGFPIARLRAQDDGSNLSTRTHSENAFQDHNTLGTVMNPRFPALSKGILPNNMSNDVRDASGEFASLRMHMEGSKFSGGLKNKH